MNLVCTVSFGRDFYEHQGTARARDEMRVLINVESRCIVEVKFEYTMMNELLNCYEKIPFAVCLEAGPL